MNLSYVGVTLRLLLLIEVICDYRVFAELERVPLERPDAKISLPAFEAGEYSDLQIEQNDAHVRIDYKDRNDQPQYVHWEYSHYLTTTVESEVERNDGYYIYNYSVTNSEASIQELTRLIIECHVGVFRQGTPNSEWRESILSKELWKRTLCSWITYTNEAEPGGPIRPGTQGTGFGITSPGFPSIVTCWATSGPHIATASTELPGAIESAIVRTLRLLKDAASGVTVGPGAAPARSSDLQDYLQASRNQGWVAYGDAYESLSTLISRAATAERENDTDTLIVTLTELETTVASYLDADPPLVTTEVEALLGLNAAFLREKMLDVEGEAPAQTVSNE